MAQFDSYLLGRTSADEREELEEQLFSDDQLFEAILAAEDDLILRFLKGKLSGRDRRQFEREYLKVPAQRARVEFLRDLLFVNGKIEKDIPESFWTDLLSGRGWRFIALQSGLAAAALIAIIATLWLAFDVVRLRDSLERSERTRHALTEDVAQLRSDLNRERQYQPGERPPETAKPPALSFVLVPGLARGDHGTKLLIPSRVESVRLQLSVSTAQSYTTYQATIFTPEGAQVWRSGVQSRSTVVVPASLLPSGDYVLALEGSKKSGSLEAIEKYSFRVVRR